MISTCIYWSCCGLLAAQLFSLILCCFVEKLKENLDMGAEMKYTLLVSLILITAALFR